MKIKKTSNTYMFERATETARAIVKDPGAADSDPGFRRYAAGVQVLQMHFKSLGHAVQSRSDWPAVCKAVADAQCGLTTEELLEGLLLAVNAEGVDLGDQPPGPAGPPDSGAIVPPDPARVLDQFEQWAAFIRKYVPVPADLVIPWDSNRATDAEIARVRALSGGIFDMPFTRESQRAMCRHLDDILQTCKVLRRHLLERERTLTHHEGNLGADPVGNTLRFNEVRP